MEIRYLDIKEQEAFEEGYTAASRDFVHQLQHSKNKLLNMMFDTEPYTSQRRMLKACIKLLDIYHRHFGKKLSQGVEPSSPIL